MKQPKRIAVYVRKGEADERLITFNPPADIPPGELLAHGFAIDGNRAIRSVPQTAPGGTFAERLFAAQQDVVAWLGEKGYNVDFK